MNEEDNKLYKKAEARVGLRMHFKTYLVINILIWLLWYFFRAQHGYYDGFWPLYPTIGWGFGLYSHFMGVYGNSDKAIDKEYQKLKKEKGLND